jgi:hypothetical protein
MSEVVGIKDKAKTPNKGALGREIQKESVGVFGIRSPFLVIN